LIGGQVDHAHPAFAEYAPEPISISQKRTAVRTAHCVTPRRLMVALPHVGIQII
jgi:hypothetical protein